MSNIGHIRREVRKAYRRMKNWRSVGREFDINCGMAYRIAMDGYEPKTPRIRVKLGLPAMVPAPVCPSCGVVHLRKRCPEKMSSKRRRDLWDFPVIELRMMLENRIEVQQSENQIET